MSWNSLKIQEALRKQDQFLDEEGKETLRGGRGGAEARGGGGGEGYQLRAVQSRVGSRSLGGEAEMLEL